MQIHELQQLCGETSASKGFHDDRPLGGPELANWQGNKLLLIVSEVVEAHGEIRNGRSAQETYYPEPPLPNSLVAEVGVGKARELINQDNAGKPSKPEGVPSEIADAIIRCLDFCYTEGIDAEAIINEKLAYNATRSRLHGKKF